MSQSAWADDPPSTLGQVEVVGQAASVADKSTTVWRIGAEDIAARGARTLDEALALVPGLNVRNGGDGVPRIDMRGQRTRQIKLLLNGVPVNSTADGQFDPSMIPVAQVQEIVVRTGAASVLYGEGGTAGVINVITRHGAGPVAGNVDARIGSNGTRALSSSIGGGTERLDWFLAADYLKHGDFTLPSGYARTALQAGDERVNSDFTDTDFSGNLSYRVDPALRIGLAFNVGHGDQGKPPSTFDSTDPFAQVPRYERLENIRQRSAQLSADWTVSDSTRLRGWVYGNALKQDELRFDGADMALLQDASVSGGFDETTDSRSLGYHAQLEHTLNDRITVSLAADTRRDSYSETGRVRDVATTTGGAGSGTGGGSGSGTGGGKGTGGGTTTTTYGIRTVDTDNGVHVDSLTGEADVRTTDATGLVLGAGWVAQRRDTGGDQTVAIGGISGYWDADPAVRLKAGLSRKARAPSVAQLYDSTRGNPDLKMEETTTAELGTAWRVWSTTSVDATLFRSAIGNFIQPDSAGVQQNLNHYRNTGLEFQLRSTLGALKYSVSYTYLTGQDASGDAASDKTLQYLPRNRLALNGQWRVTENVSWSADLLSVSKQDYYSRSTPVLTAQLPSYTLANSRLAYTLPGTRTQFYVGADNLFDRVYATSYGFPQAGRSYYAGVSHAF